MEWISVGPYVLLCTSKRIISDELIRGSLHFTNDITNYNYISRVSI